MAQLKPVFPTKLHQDAAEIVRTYFKNVPETDTVLVVNSCARGQALAESDLDFAILVSPETAADRINIIHTDWQTFSGSQPAILKYNSNPYAHLHLDIIEGKYTPAILEPGEAGDSFEIEIGNQIAYSALMNNAGPYFQELQHKWLPYYDEALRSARQAAIRNACKYDLDHIPVLIKRDLYFHAFEPWQSISGFLGSFYYPSQVSDCLQQMD
jgi:hypothetical protein